MPRFTYKPGLEFDETKMPAEVTMFGVEFLRGQPTKVEADMFREPAQYQHALNKLRINRYFEEVTVEDATVLEDTPAPKAKKAKAVAAPVPPPDEPASE